MSIKIDIEAKELIEACARLSGVPVAKVIRNASRDYARGAKEATPLAKISKSKYYRLYDDAGQIIRYIPENQVPKKHDRHLKKVRVARGYAKASWLNVFAQLGILHEKNAPKAPKSLNAQASARLHQKSNVVMTATQTHAEAEITDKMSFNHFGKAPQNQAIFQGIQRAGLARAAVFLAEWWMRLTKQLWEKKL